MTDNNKPVCDYCDNQVIENYWYVINGDVICKQCLDENFRVKASDGYADDGDDDE